MSNLITRASGNFTDSAKWATVDSTARTSATFNTQDIELTTTPVAGAVFVPGAITVDGVAVKLIERQTTDPPPTNLMTVTLYNSSGSAVVKSVVVRVTDLPFSQDDYSAFLAAGGWHFCKFDAPVLLVAATNYSIRLSLDNTSAYVRMATNDAGDWLHMLRTTTTAAPAAGDELFIMGEYDAVTNPATMVLREMTMNSTATTIYGPDIASTVSRPALSISNNSVLAWAHDPATNYYLKLAGDMVIYSGGTVNIVGIPGSSTAVLEFKTSSGKHYQLFALIGSSFSISGSPRGDFPVVSVMLTADVAAGGTILPNDSDCGWRGTDVIGIAPTGTSHAEAEIKALSGDATMLSIPTAAVTYAHAGTDNTCGEVILLTRNITIRASDAAYYARVQTMQSAMIAWDWVAFKNTSCEVWSIESTWSMRYASMQIETQSDGVPTAMLRFKPAADHYTLQYCGIFLGDDTKGVYSDPATTSDWAMDHVVVMGNTSNSMGFSLDNLHGVFDELATAGCGYSQMRDASEALVIQGNPTIVAHSMAGGFGLLANIASATFEHIQVWRCGGPGTYTGFTIGPAEAGLSAANILIRFLRAFGNTTSNMEIRQGTYTCRVGQGQIYGEAGSTDDGIKFFTVNNGGLTEWQFDSLNMFDHMVNDVNFANATSLIRALFRVGTFSSPTVFGNYADLAQGSYIGSERHNITDDSFYITPLGTLWRDASTYHTAAPSEKLTPSTTAAFRSAPREIALIAQGQPTVSVWVRYDASYTGAMPRLVQLADPSLGIFLDVVLATMTEPADTWELLTATTDMAYFDSVAVFVVECDGVAGAVYVDDWAATVVIVA